ncbi:MAG: NusG domain II-containing protein [Treponema sp.]|nr:NusG domain II-containing protein [Treponema sp.]
MGAAAEKDDGRDQGRSDPERPFLVKPRKLRITLVDAAVVLAALSVVFLSSLGAVDAAGEPRVVIADSTGQEWIYPLDADREIGIRGPLGTTTVHIHDGGVAIESSPCPNQTCVAAGFINQPGQWVACLPNQVFVRVEGGSDDGSGIDSGTW